MVDQIFEFIGNHPFLIGTFIFLLVAFLINEGKQGGASVSTTSLVHMINREDAVVVDVRDKKAFAEGHIVDAINIPFASIDSRINELDDKKDKPVVVVCKMGQHAGGVGKKLKAAGFENVRRLSGGMAEWSAASLPLVKK